MQTESGKLISPELYEQLRRDFPPRAKMFTPVPDELKAEAEKELAGADETQVDMSKNTPLVNWAHGERNAKMRNRRQMVRASRKKNRNAN